MDRWIKKLHMYAGLLTFSVMLVYGASGLLAAFHPAPEKRQRPEPVVRYEPFAPPPGATDPQVAEQVYQRLKLPLSAPLPSWAVRRDGDNNVALDFYTVNGRERVVVLEKENRLRVETTRSNFWQYLDNLHSTTMGARAKDLRVRLWKYYNEFAIWCLSGMSLSGIYLWLSSRPGHRVAQVCFGLGSGIFLLLYVAAR